MPESEEGEQAQEKGQREEQGAQVMSPRKLLLPSLATALGVLAFTGTALAAEPAPILSGEEAPQADLTTTTATLQADVNPDGSEVSKCTFQYGTSTGYGEEAPCSTAHGEPIGAGTEPVPINAHLTGLTPSQEYHWRLVVSNVAGSTTTLDHTFVYTLGGGGLPDGREYELVTPAEKNGALIGGALNGGIGSQVADEGARMMSFSLQCFAGSPSCEISNDERQGVPFEFSRGPSGWVTHPLAPSAESLTSGTGPAFSANVDTGEVLFQTPPPGESKAGGGLDWLTEQSGSFSSIGPVAEPGNPAFNNGLSASTRLEGSPVATPSFSHLVYDSLSPLWRFDPSSKAFEEKDAQVPSVYEYEGFGKSEPRLVALAPNSNELVSGCGAEIGGKNRYNYGALAEDGETVYFEAKPCEKSEEEVYGLSSKVAAYTLFARYEHARSELISGHAGEHPIAGEACDVACQAQPVSFANFEGASTDGSRVFFTDPHQLTDGASEDTSEATSSSEQLKGQPGRYCFAPASGFTGCNLYESECPDHCSVPSERRLVDISAGDTSGEGPRVLATVAISKDGSHVYFVARGVLTGANREGHVPVNGEPNLYVYERDGSIPGGRLSFVATLSATPNGVDEVNWNTGATFGVGVANVTPDGRFLVFMSQAALTPDDTRTEANPPNQIYRYDAATGTLQRVSIGAKGFRDDGNEGVAGTGVFGNTGIVQAEAGLIKAIDPLRTDPTMSDDGRFVFFHSPIGLTPHAANDVPVGGTPEHPKYAQNIYEWEAPGTEVNGQIPCTEPTGCVFLISDGKDVAESDNKDNDISSSVQLLGSSGSGANVFFTTSDELVPQDTDTERDFYDAHICSSAFYEERGLEAEPCSTEAQATPPCLGEVCHGIPAAQQGAPTGGTLTLNGLGNIGPAKPAVKAKVLTRAQKLAAALKVCHKDRRRAKRVVCEAKAHKQYGAVQKVKKKKKGK
jgi:hypothetical protein